VSRAVSRAGVLAGIAAVLLLVATPVAWSRTGGSSSRPVPASPALGRILFRTKGCSACHTGPDSTGQSSFPDLSDARAWAGRRRPGLTAARYIRQSIWTPSAFISPVWGGSGATPGMPALSVSEPEADAIVAYLLAR
jgi:mono/diheme cytochrome c family protein